MLLLWVAELLGDWLGMDIDIIDISPPEPFQLRVAAESILY